MVKAETLPSVQSLLPQDNVSPSLAEDPPMAARKKSPATRKKASKKRQWPPSKTRLNKLIEEATVDAYDEDEALSGFQTLLQDNLALPFDTEILGVPVTVETVDLSDSGDIAALCRRGKSEQWISILEVPLPAPRPEGADWIEAYRLWRRGQ
jgi:hypothetical protein